MTLFFNNKKLANPIQINELDIVVGEINSVLC